MRLLHVTATLDPASGGYAALVLDILKYCITLCMEDKQSMRLCGLSIPLTHWGTHADAAAILALFQQPGAISASDHTVGTTPSLERA
jgi:hypothetical protein